MWLDLCIGTLIPLIGTACGAALVFFIRNRLNDDLERTMLGFAAGIMTAASFLSLLLPSLEESAQMGRLSFVPAVTGFWIGILFLFALDEIIPHLHLKSTSPRSLAFAYKLENQLSNFYQKPAGIFLRITLNL